MSVYACASTRSLPMLRVCGTYCSHFIKCVRIWIWDHNDIILLNWRAVCRIERRMHHPKRISNNPPASSSAQSADWSFDCTLDHVFASNQLSLQLLLSVLWVLLLLLYLPPLMRLNQTLSEKYWFVHRYGYGWRLYHYFG